MIKVMVVDDEIPSQKELTYLISRHRDFVVAGTAASGKEALRLIAELKPDVVFLDIQLYDTNGLELAEKISGGEKEPVIIFATAYDNYAVRAFELDAFDYVVKPFNESRVDMTLERVRKKLVKKQDVYPEENDLPLTRVCAQINGRLSVIDCSDIVYVSVDGRKISLHLKQELLTVSSCLQEFYEKLDGRDFLRVHRGYVVNLSHVKEIVPWFNGSYNLIMDDQQNSEIPVSRHFAKALKQKLGLTVTHA